MILVGGFNPSEKHESQLGWLFPIYGKITHVPNHQPDHVGDLQHATINCQHLDFRPEIMSGNP